MAKLCLYSVLFIYSAHETYKRGCEAYNEIVDTFGKQILNLKTGEIERRKLGEIVFSDKVKWAVIKDYLSDFNY